MMRVSAIQTTLFLVTLLALQLHGVNAAQSSALNKRKLLQNGLDLPSIFGGQGNATGGQAGQQQGSSGSTATAGGGQGAADNGQQQQQQQQQEAPTTTSVQAPSAPSGVSAQQQGINIVVSFTGVQGSGITYTATATGGPQPLSATGSSSPVTIRGVPNTDTTYSITVTASNAAGLTSSPSNTATLSFTSTGGGGAAAGGAGGAQGGQQQQLQQVEDQDQGQAGGNETRAGAQAQGTAGAATTAPTNGTTPSTNATTPTTATNIEQTSEEQDALSALPTSDALPSTQVDSNIASTVASNIQSTAESGDFQTAAQDLQQQLSSSASASAVSVSQGVASLLGDRPEDADHVARSFAQTFVNVANEDDQPLLIKCVSSFSVTVVLLIVKGQPEVAQRCVTSLVSFIVEQEQCTVVVVKVLPVFFSVFTVFVAPSHGSVVFG